MRRLAAAAVTLLLLAGCGSATDVTAQQNVALPQDAAAAVPTARPLKGTPPPNPDVGLSDEKRKARDTAGFAAYQKHLADRRASEFVQSLDPRTLAQSGILASYVDGYGSLAEAVEHADLAVLGVRDNVPVLFPGDRAVLLLQRGDDGYYMQSWSGGFAVTGGRVKTLLWCEFHDVDGMTPDDLMDRIVAHA